MTATKKHRQRKQRDDRGTPTLASRADKYKLYEQAVQCAEAEIDFVDQTFRTTRKREARLLREDFCGTATISCEWVRRRAVNRAFAVDIDPGVLQWGREHNLGALHPRQRARIQLLNRDVREVNTRPVDMVLAMNFSYWTFRDRPVMTAYFRKVHAGLVRDGVFFLDAYGGYEASRIMKESTEHRKFTYVWDQAKYNPVNGHCLCMIHFRFKDGSRLNDAFIYEWRLWTLPELTEMLTDAGFRPTVYWEGTDEHGEGNGVFTPTTEGEADAGWIAYIVAEK